MQQGKTLITSQVGCEKKWIFPIVEIENMMLYYIYNDW